MKTIGIYLLKKDNEVVYVGQSIDIDGRIATHKREQLKDFDSYHIIECSKENLDSVETFYIYHFMPKYNKKLYEINIGQSIKHSSLVKKKNKECTTSVMNTKLTDLNIGKYYDLTRQTVNSYRNGKEEKQRLYEAMKLYFLSQQLKD